MAVREEILEANERYGASFTKGDLPMPPGRRFAVVTCMDARLDPARFLGLEVRWVLSMLRPPQVPHHRTMPPGT